MNLKTFCSSTQSAVAQVCYPSYSGGREQKNHSSRQAWAKFTKLHLNQWLGMVTNTCYLNYAEKNKYNDCTLGRFGHKTRLSQKWPTQKGLGAWLKHLLIKHEDLNSTSSTGKKIFFPLISLRSFLHIISKAFNEDLSGSHTFVGRKDQKK
jgi:hypothetical protein